MMTAADSNSRAPAAGDDPGRGRDARTPVQIPRAGWLDVLARVKEQIALDNVALVAGGVAFYTFLAVVPAIAAVIAIYALVAEPGDAQRHVQAVGDFLPVEVMGLVEEQMTRLAAGNQKAGWGALIAILIALYGSAKGVKGLIAGLNVAYSERESRGFIQLNLLAIGLTGAAILSSLLIFGLVAVLPGVLAFVGLGGGTAILINLIRWPLLLGLFLAVLAVLYRFGPCRRKARWVWLSPGAVLSLSIWALGSIGFSLYVSHFGNYGKTYGALGAVVVFLTWLFLSAFAVLLGAELNSELERQTRQDTTVGSPRPMGERGAVAADTVGPARGEAKAD